MSVEAQRIDKNECPNCGRSCIGSGVINSYLCRYCYDSYTKGYVAAKNELAALIPRWVSVEEELPTNHATVFVFPDNWGTVTSGYFTGFEWQDSEDLEYGEPILIQPTHWLKFEMPEVPQIIGNKQ